MRRVSRPPVPAEAARRGRADEQARLKEKIEEREPLTTGDFKAYKTDGVREALNDRFRFKCAYCESVFGATQPVAIEHYRPEGAGHDRAPARPRLLLARGPLAQPAPSCTDCNSPRGQMMRGQLVTIGKGNQFPIADEARRSRDQGDGARGGPPAAAPVPRHARAPPRVRPDGVVRSRG